MKKIREPKGYTVDIDGNVYSLKHRWGRRKKPLLLSQNTDRDGYKRVELYNSGKKKQYLVHRLVLVAFVGACPKGKICRHLDGNPANNKLDNIKWGTYKENEADKAEHGTRLLGQNLPWTKLTERCVIRIRALVLAGIQKNHIAELFGVTPTTIGDITKRRSWKYV